MYGADKDALLCDLAETYGIFDMRALPTATLAVLAVGLSPDSRAKRSVSGLKVPLNTLLLSMAVDKLSLLFWAKTKDGGRGVNRPKSIAKMLLGGDEKQVEAFDSPEEFEAAREKIRGGHNG